MQPKQKIIRRNSVEQDRGFVIKPLPIIIIIGVMLLCLPIISYFSYQRQQEADKISAAATRLVCETWNIAKGESLNTYSSLATTGLGGVSVQTAMLTKKINEDAELATAIKQVANKKHSFEKSVKERATYVCGADKKHVDAFFRTVEEIAL